MKIAEDFAMLQHLADGRVDLMLGRGNTGPVYPWFGQDIRMGIPLAIENYALLRQLWREEGVDWQGRFRSPLQAFTSTPRPLDDTPPFVWQADPLAGDRRAGRLLRRRVLRQQHLLAEGALPAADRAVPAPATRTTGTARPSRRSWGSAGQVFLRKNSQDAVREFRPYFDNAPVYGHGHPLEEFTEETR
ncbi:LLM class flavin-dependent oxidoreductase [Yinghuangia aomiensis]